MSSTQVKEVRRISFKFDDGDVRSSPSKLIPCTDNNACVQIFAHGIYGSDLLAFYGLEAEDSADILTVSVMCIRILENVYKFKDSLLFFLSTVYQ